MNIHNEIKEVWRDLNRLLLAEELRAAVLIDPSINTQVGVTELELAERYADRNRHVMLALAHASVAEIECGIGFDPKEPDWPVVYIRLPTGQVSWHLPAYAPGWDGHTNNQKVARIDAYHEVEAGGKRPT